MSGAVTAIGVGLGATALGATAGVAIGAGVLAGGLAYSQYSQAKNAAAAARGARQPSGPTAPSAPPALQAATGPDEALNRQNQTAATGPMAAGNASTLLTGVGGVQQGAETLGKNTLLGG